MPTGLAFSIAACAYLTLVGWVLSALQQLNAGGYWAAFLFGFFGLVYWCCVSRQWRLKPVRWRKWRNRFRRPFPLLFAGALTLAFFGGLLHAPNNYDALTYRLPRILHWLAENRWHWIFTPNDRMNYSGMTWEWMATPVVLLTRSDRPLFLFNIVAFAFMPGLLFSVFRRLGVTAKNAWFWMWVLPMAYGFVLQAGSIGNDLLSTFFFLSSLLFALRARAEGGSSDLWMSILSAALMTGVKASNLPLLLPLFTAIAPALIWIPKRWKIALPVIAIAATISFLPTAYLNHKLSGDWAGDPENRSRLRPSNPVAAFVGNSYLVVLHSALPPVLPLSQKVDSTLVRALPESVHDYVVTNYPRFKMARLNELPQEEGSGLGLPVGLLFVSVFICGTASLCCGRFACPSRALWIGGSAWVAFFVFMAKLGSEAVARLALPFYPLLLLPFLAGSSCGGIIRTRPMKAIAFFALLSPLIPLVLTPSRPLVPSSALRHLSAVFPDNSPLARAVDVYSAYAKRNDSLRPVGEFLPTNAAVVGLVIGSDTPEYSLWKPLGKRRLVHLWDGENLLAPEMEWVVASIEKGSTLRSVQFDSWLEAYKGTIVGSTNLIVKLNEGPLKWSVIRFAGMRRVSSAPE